MVNWNGTMELYDRSVGRNDRTKDNCGETVTKLMVPVKTMTGQRDKMIG